MNVDNGIYCYCVCFTVLFEIGKSDLSKFTIFSDSMSVLKALRNIYKLKHQTHVIQEINQALINCKLKQKDIELVWIPAHKNILDNENADSLAKKAAIESPMLGSDVPHSDVDSIFKSLYIKESEDFLYQRAITLNKGTVFFENFHKSSTKPWFSNTILTLTGRTL
ncbi:hypothetical protein ALC62_06742 [Cyphomyrmex costatus]|uniref:RNase H type-1 domain-containing protein n=1 Tax=Cyphomyrmex costatus TaxID=456900 RepID=A0A195CPE3_9HYME|nr:hypothetical protein ALC62_06742 [Cyphomyrmex costatus]